MKRKIKNIVLLSAVYIGVSSIVYFGSREDGTISNWIIQSLLGPIWHLSSLISACRASFNYIDGGFRISGEDILLVLVSLVIWLSGGFFLCFSVYTESQNIKKLCLIGLLSFWFLVGWYNLVLYGVYSL
jgi:hypothetical protein